MLARSTWVIIAFIAINLLLNTWFLDNGRNDNSISRAAMVAAIVHHGTFRIDQYHEEIGDKALIDGHYFSEKAPLPALLVTPFYWLLEGVGIMTDSKEDVSPGLLQLGGIICGSIPFVLILLLCWRTSGRSIILCTLPFYASFLFVYSGSFYNHLIAAVFALVALLFLEKNRNILAGVFAGAAFLCEYTLLLIPMIWVGQQMLKKDWKKIGHLIVGLLPAILFCLAYNYMITGNALTFPYHFHASFDLMTESYGFGRPTIKSVYGLSFSPYRGLFFFAPALLILLPMLVGIKNLSQPLKSFMMDPLLVPAIGLFALMTLHTTWGAGWAYGPRYLTATAVFLLYFLINRIDIMHYKYWFWPLVGFGLICSFLAKFTLWYDLPTEIDQPLINCLFPAIMNSEWTGRLGLGGLLGLSGGVAILVFLTVVITSFWYLYWLDNRPGTAFRPKG